VVPSLWLDPALHSGGRDRLPVDPPFVPGTGVAATVSAAGEDVDGAWSGRACLADSGRTGAYVERVVVLAVGSSPFPSACR
jgi:NADPH2:quinone reductase